MSRLPRLPVRRAVSLAIALLAASSAFADDLYIDFSDSQTISTPNNFADWLVVGEYSSGSLAVVSGGSIQVYQALFGYNDGSHGTVNVTGASARLTTSGNTYVGYEGDGTFNVSAGGYAQTVGGFIGAYASGATGSVTITGNGSRWETSQIDAGFSGTGSLTVDDGAVATANWVTIGAFSDSSGTITLRGTPGHRGALETGTLSTGEGIGSMTFDGGVLRITSDDDNFNGGTTTIASAGAFIDTNGHNATFSAPLVGCGALTKQGEGVLTLSGDNTFAGDTIVEAGTLQLGSDSALGSGPLTMSGGTLELNGFNASVGALALTASSSFDFGTGASGLTFADSSALAWTGTLTLLNFTLGSDSLNFGLATGLTADQLSQIDLAGYTATGLDASGFVQFSASAIPEPSTYAATAALVALACAMRRRSRKTVPIGIDPRAT